MEKKMYTAELEKARSQTGVRTIDKLSEALAAGDLEKARALHQQNIINKTNFHDFAVRWVNQTLNNFKKHADDEAMYACMKDYARTFYPPVIKEWVAAFERGEGSWQTFPLEAFIENRANLWQAVHDNADGIWEEDEEKITFILERCNSGGWLTTECSDPICTVDKAHTWCYNREGFQCYCLNCTTMWEFGWYEWFGWPLFIMDVPPVGGDGRCVMVLYKDPRDIPDAYYARSGLKRRI